MSRMSLTKGERSALQWLLAVIVIGTGVQMIRQWRHRGASDPSTAEQLSRQLLAVDSAQRASRRGGASRGRRPAATGRARSRGSDSLRVPAARSRRRRGAGADSASGSSQGRAQQLPRLGPVDLDRADVAELERLPRIGPALAARIVADRSAKGPFGSLEELQRVRGIGPKMAQALSALVTFSGTPRPHSVQR